MENYWTVKISDNFKYKAFVPNDVNAKQKFKC